MNLGPRVDATPHLSPHCTVNTAQYQINHQIGRHRIRPISIRIDPPTEADICRKETIEEPMFRPGLGSEVDREVGGEVVVATSHVNREKKHHRHHHHHHHKHRHGEDRERGHRHHKY